MRGKEIAWCGIGTRIGCSQWEIPTVDLMMEGFDVSLLRASRKLRWHWRSRHSFGWRSRGLFLLPITLEKGTGRVLAFVFFVWRKKHLLIIFFWHAPSALLFGTRWLDAWDCICLDYLLTWTYFGPHRDTIPFVNVWELSGLSGSC